MYEWDRKAQRAKIPLERSSSRVLSDGRRGRGYAARREKATAGARGSARPSLLGLNLGAVVRPRGRSAFLWRNTITLSAAGCAHRTRGCNLRMFSKCTVSDINLYQSLWRASNMRVKDGTINHVLPGGSSTELI